MFTSTVYDNIHRALQQQLPTVRASHVEPLALIVAGATQAQAAHLAALARTLPVPTTQDSKEQRIRRVLDTPRISRARHYFPIARTALAGLMRQRVDLVLAPLLLGPPVDGIGLNIELLNPDAAQHVNDGKRSDLGRHPVCPDRQQ